MGDTDKMCVYEGYNKARDCRVETLVKHEVHRYLSTSEWINAAIIALNRIKSYLCIKRIPSTFIVLIKNMFNLFSLQVLMETICTHATARLPTKELTAKSKKISAKNSSSHVKMEPPAFQSILLL